MSVESIKELFEKENLSNLILHSEIISDTVEHAAMLYNCEPAQIAKTMSFLIGDDAIVIVSSGIAKIDNGKYKAKFNTKAKMIPFDEVEKYTGHLPGGVSPFALKDGVKVYLDVSLKKFDIVYVGGGDDHHTITVTIPQLEKLSNASEWIHVCKGWEE